jgi:hypothetical protein
MSFLGIIVLLSAFTSVSAQKYYNDAQLRLNLGLEKRITKKFSITLDQQDRFTKNVSEFNRASFDIGLTYKLTKYLKIKADYVFIEKKNNANYFIERNWYYVAAIFKVEKNKWTFFYRNLAQARMGPINSDEASITKWYDRSKITVKHETTRRTSFWIAEEVYVPLNNPQSTGIDRSRTYIGTTIKTLKDQNLEFYFMYQAQLQRGKWFDQTYKYQNNLLNRYFIYGINYNIEF